MSLTIYALFVSNAFTITALAVIALHYRRQHAHIQPFLRNYAMSLQTDLDTANANLAAAQEAQRVAQAAFDAAQPHLSLWAEVEAEATKLAAEAQPAFASIVAKARALLGM